MKQGAILYEPLPCTRIGIREVDQEVIFANDYSCMAQMLEEYISYGATKIVIPASAAELKTIDQMPLLLKNRVLIIDDSAETETIHRLLFKLRMEFKFEIDDENFLRYPKTAPTEIIDGITQIHEDLKKICLCFNHGIQADINTESSIKNIRFLKMKITDSETRIVLSDIEAFLNQYKMIEFDAITPPSNNTPRELINLFDRLINNTHYLEYSESINKLVYPESRATALIRLRELTRLIRSKNYIAEGWDYVSKILKIWTGIPIPESKTIASLFSNQELPSFVNMESVKQRSLMMWRNSQLSLMPLRRDGLPISDEEIRWFPPYHGIKARFMDKEEYSSFGSLEEFVKLLQTYESNEGNTNNKNNG